MIHKRVKVIFPLCVALLFLQLTGFAHTKKTAKYDVVVYGGTTAGIMAAIAARQSGATVVLLCPYDHIGGVTSSGLGWTDIGNPAIVGGLAREFYHRVYLYYQAKDAWKSVDKEKYEKSLYGIYRVKDSLMWTFEPHVAERIFKEMLDNYKVRVKTGVKLNRSSPLKTSQGRIRSIKMMDGASYEAAVYIDATYEGDLMSMAGVSYTTGREANAQYGETIGGIEAALSIKNNLPRGVDPYKIKGDPSSGLLAGINKDAGGADGQADDKLQAYCYRVCLTDDPDNRIRITRPTGYKASDFELVVRATELGERRLWKLSSLPNRKLDANNDCGISTDMIGGNKGYIKASYKQRKRIALQHRYWTLGLIWTVQNDSRVPAAVRQKFSSWGLPKDEFMDNGNFPYALYVREARRMVSDFVMTEKEVLSGDAEQSIAMGAYPMDSHNTQRYLTARGDVQNEGDVQISVKRPYPIPYGAIIPKAAECKNLLVPVCLSATHIAYGSIRMEPVFMVLGQSAGTAAAMTAKSKQPVQSLPYGDLKAALISEGQVLQLPPVTKAAVE